MKKGEDTMKKGEDKTTKEEGSQNQEEGRNKKRSGLEWSSRRSNKCKGNTKRMQEEQKWQR